MPSREVQIVYDDGKGRIAVTDSLTFCDDRIRGQDVLVGGSFAGVLAFAFALRCGVRALIGHAAGLGKGQAGISGLSLADRFSVPSAAVETMSARLGDGRSVHEDGVISHINQTARALGVRVGMRTREAAYLLLEAPPGEPAPTWDLIDRSERVAVETERGRVVLVSSVSFASPSNGRDVLCAGSHAGWVNAVTVLSVRPRGWISNDGGMAKDRSGVDGLAFLEEAGIPAVAVDAMSASIGDPLSTYNEGIVSAVNEAARGIGVQIGQSARDAAGIMLHGFHSSD